jgi:polyisoprenoid-binding protein YceI
MSRAVMQAWVAGIVLFTGGLTAGATTYQIDRDHSGVTFKIRHLFSKVPGQFNQFEGTVDYTPGQPETWKANAVIQAASIDTGHEKRDAHLRTADFFDVEKFPTITFTSTKVTGVSGTSAAVEGLLTMHGVEKPVTLDVQIHGEGKDPWGNMRSGFTATTKVNRKDFGIVWNQALESGDVLLGDEVEITLEIEGIVK